MKCFMGCSWLFALLLLCQSVFSLDSYLISTVAGSGATSASLDDISATSASFNKIWAVWVDSGGMVYFTETNNFKVRSISSTGIVSTVAGTGSSAVTGSSGGPATSLGLKAPESIWGNGSTFYFTDYSAFKLYSVTDGIINTFAGNGANSNTYLGDGVLASSSSIYQHMGVGGDTMGNIYIGLYIMFRILKVAVTDTKVTTVMGTGTASSSITEGGVATSTYMGNVLDLYLDGAGNLYFCESNVRIRRVSASGIVNTYVGTGTANPSTDGKPATSTTLATGNSYGVWIDTNDNLFYSDSGIHKVKTVNAGKVYTVAGTGSTAVGLSGLSASPATQASINSPKHGFGLDLTYFADYGNNMVRQLSVVPTAAPTIKPTVSPTVSRLPTRFPTVKPSLLPSSVSPTISVNPTIVPTDAPTAPTMEPTTAVPTLIPSVMPSVSYEPTVTPSSSPTCVPSFEPSASSVAPSTAPTPSPTFLPSYYPSCLPICDPSLPPSCAPTVLPSVYPSLMPTVAPSNSPSNIPTLVPTNDPSIIPSIGPSIAPSVIPIFAQTIMPSVPPSSPPSAVPTMAPSVVPSELPSLFPSLIPNLAPTVSPTVIPSAAPTAVVSVNPSESPSALPALAPTQTPSMEPSCVPTFTPTALPSTEPSGVPTIIPSLSPTVAPSVMPSTVPTGVPSGFPSGIPSIGPTLLPSAAPSTDTPSRSPSLTPSIQPSFIPTGSPSGSPSDLPSVQPVLPPTRQPSVCPSLAPVTPAPTDTPSIVPSSSPSEAPTTLQYYLTHPKNTLPSNRSISVIGPSQLSFRIVMSFLSMSSGPFGSAFSDIELFSGTKASISYVVYGSSSLSSPLSLSLAYAYSMASDSSKRSVSVIKDVNGDAINDLIIGDGYSSRCYVLFGTASGLRDMMRGFTIFGESDGDLTGWSASSAGDVNNDSIADIIVGAPFAGGTGAVYVIYGRNVNNYDVFLNNLTNSQGFAVYGSQKSDFIGIAVSNAGDVNGDSYDDILFGAVMTSQFSAGAAYVIYGNRSMSTISLASLTSHQGFKLSGISYSYCGYSVSSAGDTNKDGLADILVGSAPQRTTLVSTTYLVYGSRSQPSAVSLAGLMPPQGVRLTGGGFIVSSAGDINSDGFDDMLVGGSASLSNTAGTIVYTNVSFLTSLSAQTHRPTLLPSALPSVAPKIRSVSPTKSPSLAPSRRPTAPTQCPTTRNSEPSVWPSSRPSGPSMTPSESPSESPSMKPSEPPTDDPTCSPSVAPSGRPSIRPTNSPSVAPTIAGRPTVAPLVLSRAPVTHPSLSPTIAVSRAETSIQHINLGTVINNQTVGSQTYVVNTSETVSIYNMMGNNRYVIGAYPEALLTILYFNKSNDVIDLTAFVQITAFTELFITEGSVVLTLPSQQIIHILNIHPSDVSASNFVFYSLVKSSTDSKATHTLSVIAGILVGVGSFIFLIMFLLQTCDGDWFARKKKLPSHFLVTMKYNKDGTLIDEAKEAKQEEDVENQLLSSNLDMVVPFDYDEEPQNSEPRSMITVTKQSLVGSKPEEKGLDCIQELDGTENFDSRRRQSVLSKIFSNLFSSVVERHSANEKLEPKPERKFVLAEDDKPQESIKKEQHEFGDDKDAKQKKSKREKKHKVPPPMVEENVINMENRNDSVQIKDEPIAECKALGMALQQEAKPIWSPPKVQRSSRLEPDQQLRTVQKAAAVNNVSPAVLNYRTSTDCHGAGSVSTKTSDAISVVSSSKKITVSVVEEEGTGKVLVRGREMRMSSRSMKNKRAAQST